MRSREEFNRLIIKKKLKEGDTVFLIHENNWLESVVLLDDIFAKVWFKEGLSKSGERTEKWSIHYASLSGLTYTHFGKKVEWKSIRKWKPKTPYERECVKKIRKDLKDGTHKYIR